MNDPAMNDTVIQTIRPVSHDLGAFEVRRALPARERTMVGPFIFVDQFGPANLGVGGGMAVRPHPHIGLATVTWLFEGAIDHRDSLGSVATIRPGQVNLMTAGRGIVHSERSPDSERGGSGRLYGMQTWLALPDGQEDIAPAFESRADLPQVEDTCVAARVIMGTLWGRTAPTTQHAATIYAEIVLAAGGTIPLDDAADERAVMLVGGEAAVEGQPLGLYDLVVLKPGAALTLTSQAGGRGPGHAAGRRSLCNPAPCVVELRPLLARSDQPGQGRLARWPVSAGCGRSRIHPVANGADHGKLPISISGQKSRRHKIQTGGCMTFSGQAVWITGASSGIGAALARQLAADGARLVLSGRNVAALEDVARTASDALILPFEATDYAALPALAAQAWDWAGGIDCLINNAGISQRSLAVDTAFEVYERIVAVDLLAPIALTQAVLPRMAARGSGRLAMVSSVAGTVGSPLRAAYSAAKFGVVGYAGSVRAEVAASGIRVHVIFPGSVRTDVSRNALNADGSARGFSDKAIDNGIDPDAAAREMIDAMLAGKREIVVAEGVERQLAEATLTPETVFDQFEALMARGYADQLGARK
jgi:redox-sensitive bicupin YhaK (pirin superfamily)/short-subunit dehydrogenase